MSGIFFTCLLSACVSAPQSRDLLARAPLDIPEQVELAEVGFFPQRKYQCGPAALATVLDYQGLSVSPDDLTSKVYLPQRKGSLQAEMVATGRSYGLLAYKIPPNLSELLREVSSGNPVLVFQNLSLAVYPKWHYAVVVGYDLQKAELILRSKTIHSYTIDFATFERTWQRAKHWAYVFLKPGEMPITANPIDYVEASQDLQAQSAAKALKAFRAGAARWPDNSIILMALGNTEYDAGNFDNAYLAFSRELNYRKNNTAAWNNLAYVLAAKNCKDQAIEVLNFAISLSPDNKNLLESKQEISQGKVSNSGFCQRPAYFEN